MWKAISGFESLYEASNNGDIRRVGGRVLKPQSRHDGYLQVSLSKFGVRKSYKIHRLIADTFIKNPDDYNVVNHLDGNKKNNNSLNLEWTTSAKNNQHAWNLGLNRSSKKQRDAARKTIGYARSVRLAGTGRK